MNECTKGMLLVLLMIVSKPAISLAAHCFVEEPTNYTAPYDLEECPSDVQTWMDRVNGCEDLNKHRPITAVEAERMEDAAIDLECAFIACDYLEMINKYKGNGVMTNILEGFKNVVYGKNTNLQCDFDR